MGSRGKGSSAKDSLSETVKSQKDHSEVEGPVEEEAVSAEEAIGLLTENEEVIVNGLQKGAEEALAEADHRIAAEEASIENGHQIAAEAVSPEEDHQSEVEETEMAQRRLDGPTTVEIAETKARREAEEAAEEAAEAEEAVEEVAEEAAEGAEVVVNSLLV